MEDNKLNKEIEIAEEELILNPTDMENIERLNDYKNKLTSFNEKPSKYFLNLENKNFVSKNIRELKVKNGNKIHKPDEILKKCQNSIHSYIVNITL